MAPESHTQILEARCDSEVRVFQMQKGNKVHIPGTMQSSQQGLRLHPVTEHINVSEVRPMNIHAARDMSSGTQPMKKLLIFRAWGLLELQLESCEPVSIISLSRLERSSFPLE